MQNKRRVVITGLGAVAPNGIGKDKFWEALINGQSGIKAITRFDTSPYPTKVGGEVQGFEFLTFFKRHRLRQVGRAAQFMIIAAKEAIKDSGLVIVSSNAERIGTIVGTAIGDIGWAAKEHEVQLKKGPLKANPLMAIYMSPNTCSAALSIAFGIKGPSVTISTVCASGLNSVDYSMKLIREGVSDVMIVGGTEATIFESIFDAFCMINIMTTSKDLKTPKPFDRDRDGFVLSEGSGALVIEELSHAVKRGAHIYAEIIATAITCDGYHPVELNPDGKETTRAIGMVMQEANIKSEDIDYISAHGLGTKNSDAIETKAIKKALGSNAYNIPISSIKSMIGQPIAASGALQLISSALTIKHGIIPPTINYEKPDIECDLDYVPNKARNKDVNTVLINSFGFGGKNVTAVIKKFKF